MLRRCNEGFSNLKISNIKVKGQSLMNTIVTFLMIFSLVFSPYQAFSVPCIKGFNSCRAEEARKQEEANKPVADITPLVSTPDDGSDKTIKLNSTLDLDGYCTIKIPSKYFTVITEESTFTKKVIRYKDKRTRLTMSYVRNMDRDADVPGYIVREEAGVDIVTNSKHDVEYESGTWTVVPAEKQINGENVTIYYIDEQNENDGTQSAFWIRANVYPDSDDEEFQEVLTAMLNSYNMYYLGKPIFEIPTTGYYADHDISSGTVADTSQYKDNTQEHTVFQTENQGFVLGAPISSKWTDMEIIIDDSLIKLPCKLQDFYDAGFKINDSKVKTDQVSIMNGTTIKYEVANKNGTSVILTAINNSKSDRKTVYECDVVRLDIDTSNFLLVAGENETGSESENEVAEGENSSGHEGSENGVKTEGNESGENTNEQESETTSTENNDESTEESTEDSTENTETSTDEEEEQSEANLGQASVPEHEYDGLAKDHKIVLAMGVTLNIYSTDLLAAYTDTGMETGSELDTAVFTWRYENKTMIIKTGLIKNIKHITLSTILE